MSAVSAITQLAGTAPRTERDKLSAAARQFEAIFVRQMLSAARQTSFGDDLFGGQGNETFTQMRDERFADIAAESGAFGFGAAIEKQLAARLLPEKGA